MISLRSLLARRIARILDSTRTLSTQAGWRAIAATLAAGLAGTLLVALLGVGGGHREVRGDEPKVEKSKVTGDGSSTTSHSSPRGEPKTVKGRVVEPDGKPIPGATVTVARYRPAGIGPYGEHGDRQELGRVVADAEGRFTLTYEGPDPSILPQAPESPDRWRDTLLVAAAPGFGPVWVREGSIGSDVTEAKPIRLVRDDTPIDGRIVDLEGRPVPGASVRVLMVWKPQSAEAVDQWLKAVDRGPVPAGGEQSQLQGFPAESYLPGNEPAVPAPVTTDAVGRFRLTGLGRDRQATLAISGPAIAFRRYQVVTRQMKRVEGPGGEAVPLFDRGYHGADCTIVVEPGLPIEGVVRDTDSRAPIPGAIVTAMQLAGTLLDIQGLISTTTDAEGHYRLVGLPKASGHKLSVYPPLERPYFITEFLEVPAGPGLGPVRYDIALKRGIWITGRVTDSKTRQPVQAAIHYYPFLANECAKDFRNFDANSLSLEWTGSRYRTDTDGRFRIAGLPGRGIVAAQTFDRSYRLGVGVDTFPERPRERAGREEGLPTYNRIHPRQFQSLAAIDPPAGVEEVHRDLTVEPTPSLTVQLVDPQGQPITHVEAFGRFPAWIDLGDLNLYEQSRTQIVGLDAKTSRTVVFRHDGRKLGAVLVIRPEDVTKGGERTVVLGPCATVTGRVLDSDGKPVTGGVEPHLAHENGEQPAETILFPIPIDTSGRFRIENVIPGVTYTLHARDRLALGLDARGRMDPQRFKPFVLARDLKTEPGQVIDLGSFNATTGKPLKEPENAPATAKGEQAKAVTRTMPITGRIVDLEGRPVAGVTVQVNQITKPKGENLDAWIEAAKQGAEPYIAYKHLDSEPSIKGEDNRPQTTTDAQGRFRFDGMGAERVVDLAIQGPTTAYTRITAVTRRMEPVAAPGFSSQYSPGSQTIQGSDFVYAASPGRPLEGIVRDAKTMQPLANVEIRSNRFAGTNWVGTKGLKTTTDAQGRFELVGLPKGQGNGVIIVPADDQPYFMQEVAVPDPPGVAPVSLEIALHRGIWIEGKVTDEETGKPVSGCWLKYFPFLDNPFAQVAPGFGNNRTVPGGFEIQDRYQSRADGSYRLVGLPGRALVGVMSYNKKPYLQGAGSESIKGMDKNGHFPTYANPVDPGRHWPNSLKEINSPEGTETVHLDLALVPGTKVRVRVIDQAGKPVTGLSLSGRTGRGNHEWNVKHEAEFDVVTLAPGEDRTVLVIQEERKLGKIFHIKPVDDKDGPVKVTLEPLATIAGRVTDSDGNPVSGATIRTDPQPGGDFSMSLPDRLASDGAGKFSVNQVPTGCKYALAVESRVAGNKGYPFAFARDVAVRPGEITDVGDIQFKKD